MALLVTISVMVLLLRVNAASDPTPGPTKGLCGSGDTFSITRAPTWPSGDGASFYDNCYDYIRDLSPPKHVCQDNECDYSVCCAISELSSDGSGSSCLNLETSGEQDYLIGIQKGCEYKCEDISYGYDKAYWKIGLDLIVRIMDHRTSDGYQKWSLTFDNDEQGFQQCSYEVYGNSAACVSASTTHESVQFQLAEFDCTRCEDEGSSDIFHDKCCTTCDQFIKMNGFNNLAKADWVICKGCPGQENLNVDVTQYVETQISGMKNEGYESPESVPFELISYDATYDWNSTFESQSNWACSVKLTILADPTQEFGNVDCSTCTEEADIAQCCDVCYERAESTSDDVAYMMCGACERHSDVSVIVDKIFDAADISDLRAPGSHGSASNHSVIMIVLTLVFILLA